MIDKTKDYNETERGYVYYVWSGLLKKSFNDEKRFAIDNKNLVYLTNRYDLDDVIARKGAYNITDYKLSDFQYILRITKGEFILDTSGLFKLMISQFFYRKNFDENIKKLLTIEVRIYNKDEHLFFVKD